MALEAQKVVVQFRGLQTKVDDKQAVPGDLTLLENIRFDTIQEMKKRYGYAKLARTEYEAGAMLATFKRELLIADGRRLFGYSAKGLVDKGVYEPLTVQTQSVARGTYVQQMPDASRHPAGCSIFAWESVEGNATVSRYTVFDEDTGQPLISNRLLGTQSTQPKVLSFGNYVYVFFVSATGSLDYLRFLAVNPLLAPVEGTLGAGLSTTCVYDVTTDGSKVYAAWATVSGTIRGAYISSDGTHSGTVLLESPGVLPDALALFIRGGAGGSAPWLVYAVGNPTSSVFAHPLTTTMTSASAGFTVAASVGSVKNLTGLSEGTAGIVLFETWDGDATHRRAVRWGSFAEGGAGASINTGYLLRGVGLASKLFGSPSDTSNLRVLLTNDSALQKTYFLFSFTYDYSGASPASVTAVAKLASGVGGGYTAKAGLPGVTLIDDSAIFPYLQADRLISEAGGVRTQTGVQGARLTWNATRESLELGDTLLLTGGILWAYDSAVVAEHGFHLYPEGLIASSGQNTEIVNDPTQTGATAGTYRVCAVYEWMDNYGLVHQSAASPTVEVVAAEGEMFHYSVPPYTVGAKGTPVSVVFYRTGVNQTILFRVTSIDAPLLNDPTADFITFGEAIPDSLLSANAQLLSNPLNSMAEIPALPSDPPAFITRYRNRAITIPAEAPGQWTYSKSAVPGVPVEFNPQQFFNPVQGGGLALNSAIEMDDKLILFSDVGIYWTAGDGPAPNGTGNDYGNAFRVPADVGCSDPHSLVLTPSGVLFKSAKGIYLLGRDLSVQYIGAPVERYNDLPVTSTVLVPNSRRVVFTLAQSAGKNFALVYDYFVQKWSVWTKYGAADALAFGGKLTHLSTDGTVFQETPGLFSDDGSRILIKARTSWLAFAGLSGFQRVWRFMLRGSYRGAHKLQISVGFDDNPAPAQNVEVNVAQVLGWKPNYGGDVALLPVADISLAGTDDPGGGQFANYEWQVKLLKQKSTSIQVTITEAPTETPNEGLSISVLTFLVGVLPKLKKTGARHNLGPGSAVTPPALVGGGGGGGV